MTAHRNLPVEILVTGETAESPPDELKTLLVAELALKPRDIAIDLSRLDVVSSAVIVLVAAAARELAAQGASVAVHVSPRSYEALCEWRFDSVFALYEKPTGVGENVKEVHRDGDSE